MGNWTNRKNEGRWRTEPSRRKVWAPAGGPGGAAWAVEGEAERVSPPGVVTLQKGAPWQPSLGSACLARCPAHWCGLTGLPPLPSRARFTHTLL